MFIVDKLLNKMANLIVQKKERKRKCIASCNIVLSLSIEMNRMSCVVAMWHSYTHFYRPLPSSPPRCHNQDEEEFQRRSISNLVTE